MNIKDKALAVIEFIAIMNEDEEDKSMGLIYEFSHVVNGHCKNPHEDWQSKLESMYDQLVQDGELPAEILDKN